jgi:hypothetical protein
MFIGQIRKLRNIRWVLMLLGLQAEEHKLPIFPIPLEPARFFFLPCSPRLAPRFPNPVPRLPAPHAPAALALARPRPAQLLVLVVPALPGLCTGRPGPDPTHNSSWHRPIETVAWSRQRLLLLLQVRAELTSPILPVPATLARCIKFFMFD